MADDSEPPTKYDEDEELQELDELIE